MLPTLPLNHHLHHLLLSTTTREDITTFSITFYTTVEFAEQTADIPLFVDTAIADMNK